MFLFSCLYNFLFYVYVSFYFRLFYIFCWILMKYRKEIIFLNVIILMYVFLLKSNKYYSVFLMVYIGGKMDKRVYENLVFFFCCLGY